MQAKRQFVEDYIKSLSNAVDAYNNSEPTSIDQAENALFDIIIEIRNVFSKELPNIDDAILLRNGTGIRDANSVLGILKLYLVGTETVPSTPLSKEENAVQKKIFISHRSTDKKVADIFENFLTSCGISYSIIFCSSLPGNDIETKIALEVKENLKASVLNIALLSDAYYQSAYCQNEAGIIWFLDTEKIAIAMPEIDSNLMEGFFDNEHKIRRLNNKSDVYAICDIVKKVFPDFVLSNAKLNANIDRLIEQYNQMITTRDTALQSVPNNNNKLESRILANEFSDEELLILYFFYDLQINSVGDDLIKVDQWLRKRKIDLSVKDSFDVLVDDDIIDYISGSFEQQSTYKMEIGSYRELRRLSQKAINVFEQNCLRHKETITPLASENPIDNLIIKGFTKSELLLIKYIMDLQRENLYAGWQGEQEIKKIQNWEEINTLNNYLSRNYSDVISKMEIRKFIEPCAKTSHGNIKEYRIRDTFLKSLTSLGQAALEKMQSVMIENKYDEPELPF